MCSWSRRLDICCLIDETTNVTLEVAGPGLEKEIGNRVELTGSMRSSRDPGRRRFSTFECRRSSTWAKASRPPAMRGQRQPGPRREPQAGGATAGGILGFSVTKDRHHRRRGRGRDFGRLGCGQQITRARRHGAAHKPVDRMRGLRWVITLVLASATLIAATLGWTEALARQDSRMALVRAVTLEGLILRAPNGSHLERLAVLERWEPMLAEVGLASARAILRQATLANPRSGSAWILRPRGGAEGDWDQAEHALLRAAGVDSSIPACVDLGELLLPPPESGSLKWACPAARLTYDDFLPLLRLADTFENNPERLLVQLRRRCTARKRLPHFPDRSKPVGRSPDSCPQTYRSSSARTNWIGPKSNRPA